MKKRTVYIIFSALIIGSTLSCKNKKSSYRESMMTSDETSNDVGPGYYRDKNGIRWHEDNLFAPRQNESLDDPAYKKRMGGSDTHSSFKEKLEEARQEGYEEEYEAGKEERQ